MSAKDKYSRQRLLGEYRNLIHSVNRNRLAAEEIQLEKTEDEGDLATLHQNKELLYDLHENDFQRLKSIREALKAMDRGEYGITAESESLSYLKPFFRDFLCWEFDATRTSSCECPRSCNS